MKKAGEVPFVLDHRGVARFPRKEIEEMAQANGRIVGAAPGPVVAKAFALFAQGKTWQEVTIALGQDPRHAQPVEVVRKLHEQFLDQDKRPASDTKARASKHPSQADIESVVDDAEEPLVPDVDQWQREQAEVARRAQAQHDREQREWEESQRKRAENVARSFTTRPPRANSDGALGDEPAPLSERLTFLLQCLARKPSP